MAKLNEMRYEFSPILQNGLKLPDIRSVADRTPFIWEDGKYKKLYYAFKGNWEKMNITPDDNLRVNKLGVGLADNEDILYDITLGDSKEFGNFGFTAGTYNWDGTGFKLDYGVDESGKSSLTVDNLLVRSKMEVYELLVRQIRATNGDLFVTASAKVESVGSGTVTFDDSTGSDLCPFAVGDLLVSKRFKLDGTTVLRSVEARVDSVSGRTCGVTYNSGTFQANDEAVRVGNDTTASRQNSIYLSSDLTNAPFIDFLTGVSSWATWTTKQPRLRIGNLDGVFGYSTATYGFAVGEYAADKINLTVDSTNGIKIRKHTTQLGQWDTSGNITIGEVDTGKSNVYITAGKVALRNNVTEAITLNADGTSTFTNTITLGSAATDGIIQSYGWNGTVNGFRLLGGATPALTLIGGTITGGIVQTASGTGQRVVLSGATNTLTFYDSSNNATIVQGVAGASYNIDIDKPIRVQGIIYTTLGLDVGTSKLTIDSNGNITKLNNVTYSFPSVAPTLNQILKCTNATGGVLEWVAESGGTATAITVANEATDTTCFPIFVTAATGDLGPKSNAGLAFNSSTGVLTSTFSGNLTGNVTGNVSGSAASATSATNASNVVTATDETTNVNAYVTFTSVADGNANMLVSTDMLFNPSTARLTVTNLTSTNTITGSISGNAGTVTNGVYTSGSYSNPSWITALAETKITFTDVTTGNASTSAHGFLPKLNNSATQFLNGQGAWATPTATVDETATYTWTGYHYFKAGFLNIRDADGDDGIITGSFVGGDRTFTLPNLDGTFALVGVSNADYLHASKTLTATGFAIKGEATSSTTFSNNMYGVYGSATGTTNNVAIGVYGTASGATTNWAGYFQGDTKLNGAVAVNQGTVSISSSTVAAAGKSMLRITGGSGDINTISGGVAGQIIILLNEIAGSAVTIKDAVDNINSAGDFSMNTGATITLIYNSNDSKWYEMARSNN